MVRKSSNWECDESEFKLRKEPKYILSRQAQVKKHPKTVKSNKNGRLIFKERKLRWEGKIWI